MLAPAPENSDGAESEGVSGQYVVLQGGVLQAETNRWRGLTGSLAAGLVMLALVVLGSGVIALITGAPGPGLVAVIMHPSVAVAALAAQHLVDHRRGRLAGAAAGTILVITGAALWFLWWA